jgi:transcriptional regulator with XRE-family HTH domain
MERQFQLNWDAFVEEAVRRRRELKMTQKQLALISNISLPTLIRFEQNSKDIQLSTAIQVLGSLGMTDTRTLSFPDQEFIEQDNRVYFYGEDGAKRIRCAILREALDDHFSDDDKLRPKQAFEKYRLDIEALARRQYLTNQIESDGSILLRTHEIVVT